MARKSAFRQMVDDQQRRTIAELTVDPTLTDADRQYLIEINDPAQATVKAAYYSFAKGQDARQAARQRIAALHGVSEESLERAELSHRAQKLVNV